MITIVGDTADELAILQDVIETGVLNGNKKARLDVTYKLSSGDILLTNKYRRIVGSKPKAGLDNLLK